jgi:hypothetical protein
VCEKLERFWKMVSHGLEYLTQSEELFNIDWN